MARAVAPERRATPEDPNLSIHTDAAHAASAAAPAAGGQPDISSETLLAHVLESLENMKAEDIVQIDLRGKTSIGDYMVICSGRSSRQVAAIADEVVERLKADHGRLSRTEGKDVGDWVLIDTGDVIVHVFRPEVREFYQLEKMWQPAAATA
jgi:ribosome-associated protein